MTGEVLQGIASAGMAKKGIGKQGLANVGLSGAAVSVTPQVAQFLARVPAQSAADQTAYAGVINGLVSAGIWNKLDGLYNLGAHDQTTSLTNIKQSSFGLTQVGIPNGQFTAGTGWTGDANPSHYLDSGCDPTVAAGLNFTLNSASLGGYVSSGALHIAEWLFGNGNFYIEPTFTDNITYWRDNTIGDHSFSSPGSLVGFWAVSRINAGSSFLRLSGSNLATNSSAPDSLKNQTFKALGLFDPSSLTGRWLFFGGGLSTGEVDTIGSLLTSFFP